MSYTHNVTSHRVHGEQTGLDSKHMLCRDALHAQYLLGAQKSGRAPIKAAKPSVIAWSCIQLLTAAGLREAGAGLICK